MKIYVFTIIAILFFGLVSCEDYLEPDYRDKYSELEAWKNEENANLYLTGFYAGLKQYSGYGDGWLMGAGLTDGLSDILKFGGSVPSDAGVANMIALYDGNISSAGHSMDVWGNVYHRIRRINEFLQGIDEYAKFDEKVILEMKGQARFIRGYLYFLLVRNHGSVIIRDELDGVDQASKARSSEKECWEFVAKELDYAAENLPVEWPVAEKGRVTKGAAYALKSRAMLYAGRMKDAADAAKKVIDMKEDGQVKYHLTANYADVFNVKDNEETILAVRYGKSFTHSFDIKFAPKGDFTAAFGGFAGPTQELVDSYLMADGSKFNWKNSTHAQNPYKNREPRFYASVLYNGAPWKGRTIETFVGGEEGFLEYGTKDYPEGNTVTGYFIKKLLDEKNVDPTTPGTKYWIEIRLAEVLLNYAEAQNELGETKEALSALNQIRSRVNLPEIKETNKATLEQLIQEERKIELAFENHRYWDLRRWHLAAKVLNGRSMHGMKITKEANGSFTYKVVNCDNEQNRIFPERYYHYPIPQSELRNNTACKQIENW